jgi:RNA polymerase sigma factor (sigma-70 family)
MEVEMKGSQGQAAQPSVVFVPVGIYTNQSFLVRWHQWIHKQVAQMFRRDQGRVMDTAQQIRQRFLSKDLIGRWFFKHLIDDLVDKEQAELMLGRNDLSFLSSIKPVHGHRSDYGGNGNPNSPWSKKFGPRSNYNQDGNPGSLWSIKDILSFAKFDMERYYYTPQNHTIDSDKVLELLGYPAGKYEPLASLYRQGRLVPAEFTEHECPGRKDCQECVRGRESLKKRKVSLVHRWDAPESAPEAAKLRWNDSQVTPFLRQWKKSNMIYAVPEYIMRKSVNGKPPQGIDAGLLAYALKFIRNTVINEFKLMSRHDDTSRMIYNNGMCPEHSDSVAVAFEAEEGSDDKQQMIVVDPSSSAAFHDSEVRTDILDLIALSGLSDEETEVILEIDLRELTVRQYAESVGKSVQRVHKTRTSAMDKLRAAASSLSP